MMKLDEFVKTILKEAQRGLRKPVQDRVQHLLNENAPLGKVFGELIFACKSVGEDKLALECGRRLANVDTSHQGQLSYAGLLAESGELKAALALLDDKCDDDFSANHLRGVCLSQLGMLDEAKIILKKAINQHPLSGPTWLSLIAIDKSEETLSQLKAMEKEFLAQNDFNRSQYLYAVAAAYEKDQNVEKTIKTLKDAGNLVVSSFNSKFNLEKSNDYINILKANFDHEFFKSFPNSQIRSKVNPIFIVGLPRTGTTLIEQVISSADNATGVGEVGINGLSLAPILLEAVNDSKTKNVANSQKQNLINHFTSEYLHLLAQKVDLSTEYFVEKSIDNVRYVPLLAKAFPNAKFVFVKRDQSDTAWSCYKNYFNQGSTWTYDTKNVIGFIRKESELIDNYITLLGDKSFTVEYESFVSEPEAVASKLFAYLGLEYSPQILDIKNTGIVKTISVSQVREEINTDSVGYAQEYLNLFK